MVEGDLAGAVIEAEGADVVCLFAHLGDAEGGIADGCGFGARRGGFFGRGQLRVELNEDVAVGDERFVVGEVVILRRETAAGAGIEGPAVPGAGDDAVAELALREGGTFVRAEGVDGVNLVFRTEEGERFAADFDF